MRKLRVDATNTELTLNYSATYLNKRERSRLPWCRRVHKHSSGYCVVWIL